MYDATTLVNADSSFGRFYAAGFQCFGADSQGTACTASSALHHDGATQTTCTGAVAMLIGTFSTDDAGDEQCYNACVDYAKLELLEGTSCCRANRFNGNCNIYIGGSTTPSTVPQMHAVEMDCSN